MSYISDFKSGAIELFKTDTDSSLETLLGTRFRTADGREVVLVQASSATTVASGKLYAAPAIVANHQNLATSTASAGATTVTVTLGATAATANQYAGGFVIFNAGTGAGQTLRIQSHPAASSSATLVLTLEDAIVTATSTSDTKSCLVANPYNNVIISPTTNTGAPVGVALYPIAASSYGYLVAKGPAATLSDSTAPAIGCAVSWSAATAGAIGATPYATNVLTGAVIGFTMQAATSAEYRSVFINL